MTAELHGIWGGLDNPSWATLIGEQVRITFGEGGQAEFSGELTSVSDSGGVVLKSPTGKLNLLYPASLELAS